MSLLVNLPPIGLEIPCSAYGVNVPLKVAALGVITLDFKGGIKVRVDSNLGIGLGGVKFEVIGFEMSADSPVLGKVTLRQADVVTTPRSTLELIANMPPKFKQTIYLDVDMIVEKPPGGGPALTLRSAKPLTLIQDSLSAFPPQGAVYQLQEPVDFAPVQAKGQNVVSLLQYPVTMSHNP